jgi:hypothetical protein
VWTTRCESSISHRDPRPSECFRYPVQRTVPGIVASLQGAPSGSRSIFTSYAGTAPLPGSKKLRRCGWGCRRGRTLHPGEIASSLLAFRRSFESFFPDDSWITGKPEITLSRFQAYSGDVLQSRHLRSEIPRNAKQPSNAVSGPDSLDVCRTRPVFRRMAAGTSSVGTGSGNAASVAHR